MPETSAWALEQAGLAVSRAHLDISLGGDAEWALDRAFALALDAAVAERDASIEQRDALIRDLTTRCAEEEGKVAKRDAVISALEKSLHRALALTSNVLRKRAEAEPKVADATVCWYSYPLCRDCQHRSLTSPAMCRSPKAKRLLVSGDRPTCELERSREDRCGPSGKNFRSLD